jgi:hypothetical protein
VARGQLIEYDKLHLLEPNNQRDMVLYIIKNRIRLVITRMPYKTVFSVAFKDLPPSQRPPAEAPPSALRQ